MTDAPPVFYRLAPTIAARLVGLGFLVLIVATVGFTVLVARTSLSPDLIVVLLAVGLLTVIGAGSWLRTSAYVVRLDDDGYSVRLVRGAGVKDGPWSAVTEAVAARPRDVECLVLKLEDGTSTRIPVDVLAVDKDVFAREVGGYLHRSRADGA